jgi:hypothetical protein
MLSSLHIVPGKGLAAQAGVVALNACLEQCHALARHLKRQVSLSWQQNIRNDTFCILIETKRRSFGQVGLTFAQACNKTRREIEEFLREELRKAPKRAAGKKDGKSRRRTRPAGQRSFAARQGRRSRRR